VTLILAHPLQAPGFDGLAVLGDSMSTGAAANPKIEFDSRSLWDVFNGSSDVSLTSTAVPKEFKKYLNDADWPERVRPSVRENDGGSGWVWQNVMQMISGRTIEEHRLSYGYFVGRALGYDSRNILIAGENGARASRAWCMRRVYWERGITTCHQAL